MLGKTASRHTSAEFVAFLTDIVASQPKGKQIHVILDNLSAHKTERVKNFLADHPNVHMHLTPTYSQGNRAAAARILGLHKTHLLNLMKTLSIE